LSPAAFVDLSERRRLYSIGYPGTKGLLFSLHDSLFVAADLPRLWYRTPAKVGSSGSPVSNGTWQLVGRTTPDPLRRRRSPPTRGCGSARSRRRAAGAELPAPP
jgi:hypothetical protein